MLDLLLDLAKMNSASSKPKPNIALGKECQEKKWLAPELVIGNLQKRCGKYHVLAAVYHW